MQKLILAVMLIFAIIITTSESFADEVVYKGVKYNLEEREMEYFKSVVKDKGRINYRKVPKLLSNLELNSKIGESVSNPDGTHSKLTGDMIQFLSRDRSNGFYEYEIAGEKYYSSEPKLSEPIKVTLLLLLSFLMILAVRYSEGSESKFNENMNAIFVALLFFWIPMMDTGSNNKEILLVILIPYICYFFVRYLTTFVSMLVLVICLALTITPPVFAEKGLTYMLSSGELVEANSDGLGSKVSEDNRGKYMVYDGKSYEVDVERRSKMIVRAIVIVVYFILLLVRREYVDISLPISIELLFSINLISQIVLVLILNSALILKYVFEKRGDKSK